MTSDSTVVPLRQPEAIDDPLTAILRSGARRLLAQAVEAEAEAFLADDEGHAAAGRARARWCGMGWDRSAWCRLGSARSRCSG